MDDGTEGDVAESSHVNTVEEAVPRVSVSNVVGALRLGYGLAARRLLALLIPAAVLLAPVGVVCTGLILAAVGHHGLIVDGDLRPQSAPAGPVVLVLVALVLGFIAYLVALAATVVMSAGLLLDRPVRTRTALRTAAARTITLGVLGLVVLVVVVLAIVVADVVARWTWGAWPGLLALAIALPAGWWLTLALPVAVLDGRGPWRSIVRARSVSKQRRTRAGVALMLGVLVVPALFIVLLRWALSPFDGTIGIVLGNAVVGLAGVITLPFQAATLTVAALNQRYPIDPDAKLNKWETEAPLWKPESPLGLGRIAGRLAHTGPLRVRWAALLILLLPLPGLLFGGYVARNPLGLPVDHPVKVGSASSPEDLHLLSGERPLEISPRDLSTRVCADDGCTDSHLYDYDAVHAQAHAASATLPDGTVAAAAWTPQPGTGDEDDRPQALRLFRCGTDGCGGVRAIQNAPVVDRSTTGFGRSYAVAMTATRDHILIAAVLPVSPDGKSLGLQLRLIRCADLRCAAPSVATIQSRPFDVLTYSRPIAVAAGQDGHAVVAYEDNSARVNVIGCDSTTCGHPRVIQLTPEVSRDDSAEENYMDGVDIAVPPDGRPVVAYRDPATGAARLLQCRTFDCAQAGNIALSAPGEWQSRPALALDHDGRPLIATYDRDKLALVACEDFGCNRRRRVELAKLAYGPGFLDLAVRRDGRPVMLWRDGRPLAGDSALHLTTCARVKCGA